MTGKLSATAMRGSPKSQEDRDYSKTFTNSMNNNLNNSLIKISNRKASSI